LDTVFPDFFATESISAMPSKLTKALSITAILGCGLSSASPSDAFLEPVPAQGKPMMIPLRRESTPVKRQGKIVSFRTTYSGIIGVGNPIPQQFRVVFDTGSGHVVIPGLTCESESCLVHERYNVSASATAVPINVDGTPVPAKELCDEVDIGFGTGELTGQFVRDKVCFGLPDAHEEGDAQSDMQCLDMNVVMAVKMSTQPFKSFNFDGIMGLGLKSLAIDEEFSFFNLVARSGQVRSAHFGVYLTEGDVEGEDSEIAIGGYNEDRLLHPLAWSPVAMVEHGYWQVRIKAVRIDGEEMDICKDGTCRGVVDTGTSHLGVPSPFDKEFAQMLGTEAGDLLDCRLAHTPVVEFELESINITLAAENYMRRLPLREGVNVGSATGVIIPANESHAKLATTAEKTAWMDESLTNVSRHCSPRIMPVNLPEPIGPKLFILGEPVLHRYYTVYDWDNLQVGFSLANNLRNKGLSGTEIVGSNGALPDDVELLLMQQSVAFSGQLSRHEEDDDDQVLFVQVRVHLNIRSA